MGKHTNTPIHIGQLNLRIPGTSADTAHRVANGIGQELANKVPTGMQCRLAALSVRVPEPASATEAGMGGALAVAIIRAVQK
jgi:hypothetical protein